MTQSDQLHSNEEALPIRREQCQNTKFSRSRHWKWSRLADDDLPSSPEKNQQAKTQGRLKFDLEKLKDPCVLETFQAMIGRKFASLTITSNKDTDIDSMITTFNTAVTETASKIGKHRQKKTLGHCRNSWSVWQRERTEKEKIWAWRIWEIQGSEEQHQEVHEKKQTKTG